MSRHRPSLHGKDPFDEFVDTLCAEEYIHGEVVENTDSYANS